MDLVVGIAYEADIRTAKEVLYSVAEAEEARLPEEEILVFVDELGDSSVNMGVRIWVKNRGLLVCKVAPDREYQVCA